VYVLHVIVAIVVVALVVLHILLLHNTGSSNLGGDTGNNVIGMLHYIIPKDLRTRYTARVLLVLSIRGRFKVLHP
jgi:quinol-cytochrome oxidoreductase complex cytochrome b subunit